MINKQEYDELIALIQDIIHFDLPKDDLRTLSVSLNTWKGIDIILGEKQLSIGQHVKSNIKERSFITIVLYDEPYGVFEILAGNQMKVKKQEFYSYSEKQKKWIEYNPVLRSLYRGDIARHSIKTIAEEWAGKLIHGVRFIDYDRPEEFLRRYESYDD